VNGTWFGDKGDRHGCISTHAPTRGVDMRVTPRAHHSPKTGLGMFRIPHHLLSSPGAPSLAFVFFDLSAQMPREWDECTHLDQRVNNFLDSIGPGSLELVDGAVDGAV